MAGLLGAVLGGAAKGYAQSRVNSIETQEAFDMKKALLDAEMDKQLRLKEAGIKLEQEAVDRERGKIKGLMDSAYTDPDEGKGGYESEDSKAAKLRSKLEAQSAALMQNGYMDQAKALQSELTRLDKSEMSAAQLEAKLAQIQNSFTLGKEKLEMQGKLNEANISAKAAQAEAALTRAGAAADREGKKSEKEKLYDAYAKRVKTQGAKDANGKLSKNPLSFDQWDENRTKRLKDTDSDKVSETVKTDEDGNVLEKQSTTTRKVKPGDKSKDKKLSDPFGLR